MEIYWEIDLYYDMGERTSEAVGDDDLTWDTFHGRPVYRKTVEADEYEAGSSGTLALYYSEDRQQMDEVISIRDDDLIAYHTTRRGEPEPPEPPEESDQDDWEQDAS